MYITQNETLNKCQWGLVSPKIKFQRKTLLYKNPLFRSTKNEAQVLMFIFWDCKILSVTATFHKRGVLDCNFQNPSEIPDMLALALSSICQNPWVVKINEL